METRLLDAQADPQAALREAAAILKRGGLVAFPTETVYGLGALGRDPAAVERIFVAKGRPHSDPVILHIGELPWLERLCPAVPTLAGLLTEAFWPGPLTLVLPKSAEVPPIVTAGGETVAVRMPGHPLALEVIRQVGEPLAAPSANLFSRPSPTTAAHALADLSGRIDAVLDGGPTKVGVESTVLDLTGDQPVILRPGGVTREALEAVLGRLVGERSRGTTDEVLPSPGLLTRHYSPRAQVLLFEGPDSAVLTSLREVAQNGVVLAFTEDLPALAGPAGVEELGSRADPESIARGLYAAFRRADERGAARIGVRLLPPGGLADAVNDRLRRAASGRVLRP